jgi:hypothetical protein
MGAELKFENVDTAVIVRATDGGGSENLARVYRLKDGWHAKLTNLHTKQAWSGPYGCAEDALKELAQGSQLV